MVIVKDHGESSPASPHDVGGTQGGPIEYRVAYLETFARKYNLFYNGDQLPYNTRLTSYARLLRKNATKEERFLWKYLRKLPFKVLRQRPIAHYIVDFYVPQGKVVIEIDGSQHYTNVGKVNDAMRTSVLGELGLTILRFSNTEVLNNIDGVCDRIRHVMEM
jgi:very-short-patch-repair endonuclease